MKFAIEAQYLVPVYKQLIVEADNLDAACRKALEDEEWDDGKEDYDSARPTTIAAATALPDNFGEGPDDTAAFALYSAGMPALDVPPEFRDSGEAPALNDRELGAVLAGLRLLQRTVADQSGSLGYDGDIAAIATSEGQFQRLTDDELDDLCVRLNAGDGHAPRREPLEVRRVLDCNLFHLPKEIRDAVWNEPSPFTDVGEGEHRRWVYIDEYTLSAERLAEIPLPEAVQKIVRYAFAHRCELICFDPDGSQLPADFELFEEEAA